MELDLSEYHLADRLCRQVRPTAQDYLRRSRALARLGYAEAAAVDLESAGEVVGRDLTVLRWLLRNHPDHQRRYEVARNLIAHDQAGRADVDDAVNCLLSSGERVVHHAARRGARLQGWVASLDQGSPSIEFWFGDGRQVILALSCDSAMLGRRDGFKASFDVLADRSLSVAIRARLGPVSSEFTIIYAESAAAPDAVENALDPSVGLSVIIPIYGDPDSLGACFSALSENTASDTKIIVIDDASPDPAIAEMGQRFCQQTDGIYYRSRVNGGFAAAVNLGLSLCPRGDVLLLNSDVVLPGGALERLRAAARSAPDIGTVSPLSNDSGETGFPDPFHATPVLDTADHVEVDRAARAANPKRVVDLLAALGSCLYVTRTALSRVGQLSPLYGRGYYEDVDYYLRVRQAGLRNVAACDVYVSHRGGRSFGSEKRALVSRNHVILRRRFPDFELDDMVFDFADPLRSIRAAIEERLRPKLDHVVIVVGRAAGCEALFDKRIEVWRALERPVLIARWRGSDHRVELDLAVPKGPGPNSLRYRLTDDSFARILAYLKPLIGIEVEVLEPENLPSVVIRLLDKLDRPVAVLIESLASAATLVPEPDARSKRWLSPVFPRRPALSRVVAFDRMAAAWLDPTAVSRLTRPPNPSRPRNGRAIGKLGVSLAMADAAAERFLLALARKLRREQATTLIVFGRAIDEDQLMSPGNVWVTGPLLGDDPGVIATQYGVEALLSPYRASLFWHVESLGHRLGVPIAYFDWSAGRLAKAPADLALDHRLDDADACRNIVAWCSGHRASRDVSP